jgi:hypothetical protein
MPEAGEPLGVARDDDPEAVPALRERRDAGRDRRGGTLGRDHLAVPEMAAHVGVRPERVQRRHVVGRARTET